VSQNAEQATEEQSALRQELQALLPDASVTLRIHRLTWKADPAATLTRSVCWLRDGSDRSRSDESTLPLNTMGPRTDGRLWTTRHLGCTQ
jgi:hypothetical protein